MDQILLGLFGFSKDWGFILSAMGSIGGLKAEERRTWWLFVILCHYLENVTMAPA